MFLLGYAGAIDDHFMFGTSLDWRRPQAGKVASLGAIVSRSLVLAREGERSPYFSLPRITLHKQNLAASSIGVSALLTSLGYPSCFVQESDRQ